MCYAREESFHQTIHQRPNASCLNVKESCWNVDQNCLKAKKKRVKVKKR
jgi:hypothetical protein